jgi:hypothetical protein
MTTRRDRPTLHIPIPKRRPPQRGDHREAPRRVIDVDLVESSRTSAQDPYTITI